jgi:signal transduction histidine kinase/ABC-type amino acid transport substrate-binding protein
MTNRYRILITFLCLLVLLPLHAQSSDSTRIFNREHPLVYEDAWDLWPYSFLSPDGEPVGYNIDLIKLICQELDVPYIIKLKPTQKALMDVKSGEADLMLAMDAEYHKDYGLTGKTVVQIFTHSVLRRKSDPLRIKTEADLEHNQFIVHEGSFAHHLMKEKGWESRVTPYDDMREAVQYVNNTPNQQIVWNTLSLKWLKRTLHFEELELTPVKMQHGEYKFLSNQPVLLDLIDDIYLRLEAEGRLQPIQNKWFYPERKDSGIPIWIWLVVGAMILVLLSAMGYYSLYRFRERNMTKAIRRSNARLAHILSTWHVHVWTFNVERKTVTVYNEQGEVEAENQPPTIFFSRTQADDVKILSDVLLQIAEGHAEKKKVELRSKNSTNDEPHVLSVVMSVFRRGKDGKPTDIIGTYCDVTDERQRQQQVKDNMLRYQSIFNSAMVDTIVYDSNGYMYDMNEKANSVFPGGKEAALKNHVNLRDVLGAELSLDSLEPTYFTRLYEVGRDNRVFNPEIHKRYMFYELQLMPLRDNQGHLLDVFGTGRDVTEVVKSYQRLQHNLELQEHANEEMNNYFRNINYVLQNGGVRMARYSPDTHTLLIYTNVGHEQSELTQTRALALTADDSKRQAQRMLNSMDNRTLQPQKASFNTLIRIKNGKRLSILMSFIPVLDDRGNVKEYFGACRDISEIKATEDQLAQESAKAREIETVKNAFLRNMSYEIRTPLSSVIGFAELFETPHSPEDETLFIEQIKKNSAQLLKLINDILFLSRLDAGMIEFKRKPIDFAQFFDARCMSIWHRGHHEGVDLVFDNPYQTLMVEIDDQNLGIVIDQIMENATTHTREGMVRASYEYTGEGVAMAFQDTGSGISEDRMKQIFERFVSSGGHGTGLGLAICHDIATQMGGKIRIKSEVDKGTIVWVSIPCKCSEMVRK